VRRKQDRERFADTQIDPSAPIHEDQSGDPDTSRVFQAVTAVALFALCCLIWWAYHALEVSHVAH